MQNFDPKEHVGLLVKFINGRVVNKINKNLSKFNLTRVQHEILCFIDKNEHEGDVFQKDIEKCLKLTNPTVTGIVKRLEEKEMIVIADIKRGDIGSTAARIFKCIFRKNSNWR
mgnify:CR=1 FL=1